MVKPSEPVEGMKDISSDILHDVADAIRDEFLTMGIQWFVDDHKDIGSRDCTPWNIMAEAAINKYLSSSTHDKPKTGKLK